MFQKPKDGFKRTGNHIGSGFRTFSDMKRAANRGGQDLRFKALDRIDIRYLCNQFNAVPSRVVNPPDKRRYIFCADFCRQDRLPRRKTQCTVCRNSIISKPFDGFDTLFYHRHFYNDIGIYSGEFFPFSDYSVKICRNYFGTHITLHNIRNGFIMFCNVFFSADTFLGHEGGIGRNTIQDTQVIGLPDLIQVCRVDKEFHIISLNKNRKKWQVTYIAPLNHLPLLPSGPGGFSRSWPYKTCRCKYTPKAQHKCGKCGKSGKCKKMEVERGNDPARAG